MAAKTELLGECPVKAIVLYILAFLLIPGAAIGQQCVAPHLTIYDRDFARDLGYSFCFDACGVPRCDKNGQPTNDRTDFSLIFKERPLASFLHQSLFECDPVTHECSEIEGPIRDPRVLKVFRNPSNDSRDGEPTTEVLSKRLADLGAGNLSVSIGSYNNEQFSFAIGDSEFLDDVESEWSELQEFSVSEIETLTKTGYLENLFTWRAKECRILRAGGRDGTHNYLLMASLTSVDLCADSVWMTFFGAGELSRGIPSVLAVPPQFENATFLDRLIVRFRLSGIKNSGIDFKSLEDKIIVFIRTVKSEHFREIWNKDGQSRN